MNYGLQPCEAQAKVAYADKVVELTVGQNIDNKIQILEAEIARLKASKETLSPLLDMKINDLRNAMQY